jgi:O-antigen/teichoic acid export membrane protein
VRSLIEFRLSHLRQARNRTDLGLNANALVVTTLVTAAGGFAFWQLAAHMYSPEKVGIAGALISAANLVGMLGLLGLDSAVVKFSTRDQAQQSSNISTATTSVAVATAVVAAVFAMGARFWGGKMTALEQTPALVSFVLGSTLIGVNSLLDCGFIAMRRGVHVLERTTVLNLVRLLLPVLLATLGAQGLFGAYAAGAAAAGGMAWWLFRTHGVRLTPTFEVATFRRMWRFSGGSFLAMSMSNAPSLALPLVVGIGLGARSAAVWYIAVLISGALAAVPQATAQSFFAVLVDEPGQAREHLAKTVRLTLAYQLIGLAGMVLLGRWVLHLFGGVYETGYGVLMLLSVASVIGSMGFVGRTLLLAAGRIRVLTGCCAVLLVSVMSGAIVGLRFGLVAIGVAWLAGEIVTAVVYAVVALRELRSWPAAAVDPEDARERRSFEPV